MYAPGGAIGRGSTSWCSSRDKIDWSWIDGEIAPLYTDKGSPGIESRFVIGLLLLKHIFGLSDEGVCERWVADPYFQHFTGETFFQHAFPHERSDLSHWRKRLGDKLELLPAESPTEAILPSVLAKQAAMMAGRYAHAKQFNRHHRQVRFLRTRLGRLIRDIRRKIAGHERFLTADLKFAT